MASPFDERLLWSARTQEITNFNGQGAETGDCLLYIGPGVCCLYAWCGCWVQTNKDAVPEHLKMYLTLRDIEPWDHLIGR